MDKNGLKWMKLSVDIANNTMSSRLSVGVVLTARDDSLICTAYTGEENCVDVFLDKAERCVGEVNNECVRLYATGVFQQLDQVEQIRLVIQVYVNCGLYFNIVQPELERFYLEKSVDVLGTMNMLEGMLCQEFRKVVVCGSFQQHLKEIGDVMTMLQRRGITVLSPWTTKVVPETLGTDFILLEGQELINKRDAWRHKYEHMRCISVLYIYVSQRKKMKRVTATN